MPNQDIVARFIRERSPEAFAGVVDAHAEPLRRTIFKITLNAHDADDVVQEAFITAYNKIESFKGTAKFSTWLCRVAINIAYSRQRKLRPETSWAPEHDALREASPPDAAMSGEEKHRDISAAIAGLPDKLRAALTLVVVEEMDMDEAAYALGCPKATVYWRVHKARKILKVKLEHIR